MKRRKLQMMNKIVHNPGLSHLALDIWSHLEVAPDLINCRLVCKAWQTMIDNSKIYWKKRLQYPSVKKCQVLRNYSDFRAAMNSILQCKKLAKIKRFVFIFEKYLRQNIGSSHYSKTVPKGSPIHWYAKNGRAQEVVFLLKLLPSLNEFDTTGQTAFMKACAYGHLVLVKVLIEASKTKDINLNARNIGGVNALMLAGRRGHFGVVRELFKSSEEFGIELNTYCNQWLNSFRWAIPSDDSLILDLFLQNYKEKGIDINVEDIHGYTTFREVCSYCIESSHVVSHLIEHSEELRIDLNDEDADGDTGFLLACRHGNFDGVKIIAEAAERKLIDLYHANHQGMNALMMACHSHCDNATQIIAYLFNFVFYTAVSVNEEDSEGKTAFMHAVLSGRTDIVQIFLDHSVKGNILLNHRDLNGYCAILMPTVSSACHTYMSVFENDALDLLLQNANKYGIEVNTIVPWSHGRWITSFHQFCGCRSLQPLRTLLDHSDHLMIDVNAVDYKGQTGFMRACKKGLHFNIECLIINSVKAKIDLNATDDDWMTGFMLACQAGNALAVETILKYQKEFGIDLIANDKQGRTGPELWPRNLPFPGTKNYQRKRHLFIKNKIKNFK